MHSLDSVPVVYLAGGFRSGWQDLVKSQVQGVIFLDPRENGSSDEAHYTRWDLAALERADIIFAYLEASNPSGANLALEIGWAAHGGKKIIFVEEPGHPMARHFGMARTLANVRYNSENALQNAIHYLRQTVELAQLNHGATQSINPQVPVRFHCATST